MYSIACSAVKYATADTQILTTKSQILKVAVSTVSGLESSSSLVEPGALASLFGIWRSKRLWYLPVSAPNLAYLPLDLEVKTFEYFTAGKPGIKGKVPSWGRRAC